MLVMGELCNFLDLCTSLRKAGENCTNVGTLLHGYDTELILLVDPDKEGLFFVVEDTSSIRPISVEADSFKESISLLEEEVVLNQLLPFLFS